ncbi:hypothetical protein K437DRAFT_40714 [Tilletiaria anomala UBC 951]|uniref:Hook C-terminal domain-containing protein n=1 Tax=Tilletiaria anomala (strain ATCC 24038 / CBS 436.72 / UBC 951) TaxID=1037660 RepID=A0A066WM91_TILAU|nr:uncharacterized protein K437DRAFT_40714 [Tilletiaria anomala UBC 951]KDN52119.1 hypothetical protein K437DRAFT_40714 [Tilletiaria anomala UBC 951]
MNNFKPLMDSYKKQVMELEGKASSLQKAVDTARFEKDQLTERLKNSESARASEKEELELYQERVKELELGISKASDSGATASTTAITNGDSSGGGIDLPVPVLDTELEDALTGSSMSDLKIQLRRLKRERDAAVANKADVSRIIVLENLLEDAQRMKDHYEADYLKEHQAKLVLSRELEEFRNGHSASGDGAEANIALRSRLTQLVEELDSTKKSMVELRVQHDAQSKALIIAKSDLSLVNQDQVDILRPV